MLAFSIMELPRSRQRGVVRWQHHHGRISMTVSLLLLFTMVPNSLCHTMEQPETTIRRTTSTTAIRMRSPSSREIGRGLQGDVFVRQQDDIQQSNTNSQQQTSQTAQTRQSSSSLCQLNDQGLYTTNADDLTNGMNDFKEVNYNYQTSVVTSTSLNTMDSVVIPEVDRAITTAILPYIFPSCSSTGSNQQRRRIQQGGNADAVLLAISVQRSDERLSGQSCVVEVPNSICYVSRGSTLVVFRGLSDDEVDQLVKDAVQTALQSGNSIASSVPSGLVLDVRAISDNLQSLPPVGTQPTNPPQAVVPMPTTLPPQTRQPLPSPTMRPVTEPPVITTNAPIPYSRLTSAPFTSPVNPSFPDVVPTKAPSKILTDSPFGSPAGSPPTTITSTTRPTKGQSTANPSGNKAQTGEPTPSSSVQNTREPTTTPSSSVENRSREAGKKKMPWWAWLLISISGVCVLFCLYSILARREGDLLLSSSGLKNNSHLGGDGKDDDNHDGYDYEPPPSNSFPPITGSFSITPSMAQSSNDDSAPVFVNNATKDQGEEDDESYTDADDAEDEIEYEDEDEVTEEESEGERTGAVDQESYYEDEDVYEASEVSEGGWGDQQTYASRY